MHGVFADGETPNTVVATVKEPSIMLQMINMLVKFASWGWAIIAIIAWKLMSNEFIYAPGLKLDESLFTMWNYMKNFANFTIGFLFVFKIIKSLFAKDAFAIKTELPKFLVASILANMSWFLMGVLIDVANVATAAVGSFPQIIINEDTGLKENIQKLNVWIPNNICLDMSAWDTSKCVWTYEVDRNIDKIWARVNDMSGPLLFIGASIYRFQDYDLLNKDINDFQSFTTATILKLIMIIMYMLPLIALLVVNVQRIFYLWLWIIFAPLIVVFEMLGVKPKWKFIENIFSIKEVIWMVFMPVFVIWGVAIMLILSIGMYSVMWGKSGAPGSQEVTSQVLWGAEIASAPWQSTFYNTAAGTEITYVWDVFRDIAWYGGWLIGYLIITAFVIMLLWAVVKMSTGSSKLAAGTFNNVMKLGKDLMTSVNMIPMGWSKVSLASMMNWADILGEKWIIGKWLKGHIDKQRTESADNLSGSFYNNSAIGSFLQKNYGNAMKYDADPDHDIWSQEKRWIIQLWSKHSDSLEQFIEWVYGLLSQNKKKKALTLNSTEFTDNLFNTFSNNATFKQKIIKDLGMKEDDFTKEHLFSGSNESSKKFLNFIERNLHGVKTKLPDASTKEIPAKENFILFGTQQPSEKK
jgi:hypothetical protein